MENLPEKQIETLSLSFISTCHQGSATIFVTLALKKTHNVMSGEI